MSRFKVGDIVRALPETNGRYKITNETIGYIGQVVKIDSDETFWVRYYDIKTHTVKNAPRFCVASRYFGLVERPGASKTINLLKRKMEQSSKG